MLVGRDFFCLSELRDQTNLNSGHGHALVPTISSRLGGVQLSLPTHDLGWKTSFSPDASSGKAESSRAHICPVRDATRARGPRTLHGGESEHAEGFTR